MADLHISLQKALGPWHRGVGREVAPGGGTLPSQLVLRSVRVEELATPRYRRAPIKIINSSQIGVCVFTVFSSLPAKYWFSEIMFTASVSTLLGRRPKKSEDYWRSDFIFNYYLIEPEISEGFFPFALT